MRRTFEAVAEETEQKETFESLRDRAIGLARTISNKWEKLGAVPGALEAATDEYPELARVCEFSSTKEGAKEGAVGWAWQAIDWADHTDASPDKTVQMERAIRDLEKLSDQVDEALARLAPRLAA